MLTDVARSTLFEASEYKTWDEIGNAGEAWASMRHIATMIRSNKLKLGRRYYALTLSMGVFLAMFCNVRKIVAVEFGVGGGAGLLDLCKAAAFFRDKIGIEIEVYGLDNATGLPSYDGYKDCPELWPKGSFYLRDPEALRAKLPSYAHLIIGDIAETVGSFNDILGEDRKLGFVSVDVDYYSSTMSCLNILKQDISCYMPVVPMYFDDLMNLHVTYNSWCGEQAAIDEFNSTNTLRKIEAAPQFNNTVRGRPYHACHMLDHPLRATDKVHREGFRMVELRYF